MHDVLHTPELVAGILDFFELEDLLALRLVCRAWDTAVRNAQEFWGDVRLDAEDDYVTSGQLQFFLLQLREAHSRPIRVDIAMHYPAPEVAEHVFRALSSTLHCVTSLKVALNINNIHAVWRALVSRPAPWLRDLDLLVEMELDYNYPELPTDLFAYHAPALESLWLQDVLPPRAPVPALSGVQLAHMSFVTLEGHSTIARAFNITGNTYNLRDVRFNVEEDPGNLALDVYSSEMVQEQAKRLSKLVVSGWMPLELLSSHDIRDVGIFASINSPSLERFYFTLQHLNGPLELLIKEDRLIIMGSDGRNRWLEHVPVDDKDFMRDVLELPGLAEQIQDLFVEFVAWPALCAAGIPLTGLHTLTLCLPPRMADIDRRSALRCPALAHCMLIIPPDADDDGDMLMEMLSAILVRESSVPLSVDFSKNMEIDD